MAYYDVADNAAISSFVYQLFLCKSAKSHEILRKYELIGSRSSKIIDFVVNRKLNMARWLNG